jgi:hypothetical protein
MQTPSENKLTIELIRYYQQKEALVKIMEQNPIENSTNTITLNFYNEKINSLRGSLKKEFPERIAKIDKQRKDDCTTKKPEPHST